MLVIEVVQQKYEEYLSLGSVNPTATQHCHHINNRTYKSGDEEIPIDQGFLGSMVIKCLKQEISPIFETSAVLTVKVEQSSRYTRAQIRNCNH